MSKTTPFYYLDASDCPYGEPGHLLIRKMRIGQVPRKTDEVIESALVPFSQVVATAKEMRGRATALNAPYAVTVFRTAVPS